MNRSRREIKTPKRFDDEPFETPRKGRQSFQQPRQESPATPASSEPAAAAAAAAPVAKAAPEQTPSKNIIKVKLTKSRPRDQPPPIKAQPPTPTLPPPPPPPLASPPRASPVHQSKSPPVAQQEKPTRVVKTRPQRDAPPPLKLQPAHKEKSTHKEKVTNKTPKHHPPSLKVQPAAVPSPPSSGPIYLPTPLPINADRPRAGRSRPRTPPAYHNLIPNVVLPFWDARTAAEDHEDDNVKELVHCQCGIAEELGLMVQCETCLTWQHAHCLGIEKPEDAPDGYTCQACCDPKFARESMRWAYDQEWLLKGKMKQFYCGRGTPNVKSTDILYRINRLIDNSLKIYQLIHSLRIKSRLLAEASDDNLELKLFKNEWPANYQHIDGRPFVPTTIDHLPSCTPSLSLSAMAETPDPGYLSVESMAEATLPDIGQLEDVSAILDNTDIPNTSLHPIGSGQDATPNDCRANLRLHIQQTEEFINLEMAHISKQMEVIERECMTQEGTTPRTTFESLKNDLNVIKNYMARTRKS